MMMGGNSAAILWSKHHDYRAYEFLKPLAEVVLQRRWLEGGPYNYFEVNEVRGIMQALGEVEGVR